MSWCLCTKSRVNGISNKSLLLNSDRTDTEFVDFHNATLLLTKSSAIPYIISSGINLITWSMMLSVFILYCRTFDDSTPDSISFVLSGGLICSAMANFINSWLADIYGCDYMIIIIWTIGSLALIICSITNQFIIFSIGYIIFEISSGEMTISQAYLNKMLPNNICIIYSGYISLINILSWFAGPILGGIISYYLSYKILYIVVCILRSITTIYVFIKLRNITQNMIKNKQLQCVEYYKSSELLLFDLNQCFPICLEQIQQIENKENNNNKKKKKNTFLLLICYLIEYGIVSSNEMQFINYYASYMHDKYNINIVLSTIQLAFGGSFGMLATLIIPKIYNKYQLFFNYKRKNYFVLIFHFILIIFTSLIFNQLNFFHLYWFILPIYLFISISLSMILYILIIEIQSTSTSHSGKVYGIRSFINHLLGGIETLIIGLLWNINDLNYNALWYIQCAFYVIAALLFIVHYMTYCC